MAKRVVVLASGATEQRALPHLLRDLEHQGISLEKPVRIPPRGRAVTVQTATKLARAAYWEAKGQGIPLDKVVVLVDADGKDPGTVLLPLREGVRSSLGDLPVTICFAFAQWHLEAWFFADPSALREHLGRDLGRVDPSRPDEIRNPKLHLKNLLGDAFYTANTAEGIARVVGPKAIASRSPSFSQFIAAMHDGGLEGSIPETDSGD